MQGRRLLRYVAVVVVRFQVRFDNLQDGRISCGENCGIVVLGLLTGVLGITALVTLIWVSSTFKYEGVVLILARSIFKIQKDYRRKK